MSKQSIKMVFIILFDFFGTRLQNDYRDREGDDFLIYIYLTSVLALLHQCEYMQLFKVCWQPQKTMKNNQIMLRREWLGNFYSWIVSAPMLIYGYSLAMSAANSPSQMMQYYSVDFDQNLMVSLYNGFFAAGGMLGSYLIEQFVRLTTKRKSLFICMLIIVCSCGISVIPHIATLIISRFLLGLGCGFSMIVGGIYIRQTYSERKRRSLGGVYSLFKMIGSEISLGISYFLSSNSVINIHLYITLGVGLLAVIQMVLTKFVLPEIALEMLMVKNKDELNVVLNCLYHQNDIPQKLEELKSIEAELAVPINKEDEHTQNRIISAIHCGFIRQFCGVPFFIVYSSQMLQAMHSPVARQANLMATSWRMVAGIIGIWLICILNRSKLITFTTIFGSVLCFFVALFNGLHQTGLTIASLIVYILPTASCLEIITWYYPFECTRPVYGKFAAFFSWFGMGCLIIIPPYISAAMPYNESYPTFIFFGIYLIFSAIINSRYLVDIDATKCITPDESEQKIGSSSKIGTNCELELDIKQQL